jgi:hypothetical protein
VIIEELRRKEISHYLIEVIKSYISNRYVQIDQTHKIEMTGGDLKIDVQNLGPERGKAKAFVCDRSVDCVVRIEGVGGWTKS